MNYFKKICLIFLILTTNVQIFSQTIIEGTVTEAGSGKPVAHAHIFFKRLQAGTTSDTTGYFRLGVDHENKIDTVIVSCLGYTTEKIPVSSGIRKPVTVILTPQFTQLQEFVLEAGVNPAWAILEKAIARKKNNNPESRESYSCEEYAKIRFDLNHFTEKIKQNIMVRPFDFIWENVDTTADGVTYLPVLLVEKMIDHHYQRSPRQMRDVIQGVNATGLKGPKIMNFVEDLYLTPNIYNNFVVILDKSFPSPLHDNFKNHYDYYLLDSLETSESKFYKISFYPKYKRELAFTGEMLIDAHDFAVKQVDLRFDIMANVNFVRSYWVSQQYDKFNNTYWMPASLQVIGDFTVVENSAELTGFFGRKNSTYRNYQVDNNIPKSVFKGIETIVQVDSASLRQENFWQSHRHTDLSAEESGIYDMVRRIEKDPAFVLRKDIVIALTTGYVPFKKIGIGDIYTFYSYNVIEHSRIKFGLRTRKDLLSPVHFSAYGAYGTFDAKWKYSLSSHWQFGKEKKKQKRIGAAYKYDIEQLGRSFNQLEIDHILTSLVQYGGVASRNYVTDFTAYAENNWTTGLLTRLSYFNNSISPTTNKSFNVIADTGMIDSVYKFNATGVAVTFKFSYQNPALEGAYYARAEQKIVFRKFPDVAMEWRWADKNNFSSGLNFTKYSFMLKQNVRLQKLGYLQYYIEAGKTLGTVPYPYLNIPFGNQLVFQDDYAFNLMNFLEYASDEFIAAHMQHHFGGLILDHIPLINKLKWRNFIFARAYWGNLSDSNNQEFYLFPPNLRPPGNGYYEVGFGIENIFKIARVDFTWRLTDTDAPDVYRFIVKPSFRLAF